MSKPAKAAAFDHIQSFLDKTHGQITFGEIPPIRRAAMAAQGKHVRVSLVGRPKETVHELLQRLDAALDLFIATGTTTDEVLPEIKRQRGSSAE
jgi:hypothetical protein